MTLYLEALRSLLPLARISSKFLPNIHRLPRTASPVKIFCVSTKCPFLFQVAGGTLSFSAGSPHSLVFGSEFSAPGAAEEPQTHLRSI